MMKKEILVSLLLPSYQYPEGILRILRSLDIRSEFREKVEILISDNSDDDSLKADLKEFESNIKFLKYKHHNPQKGACGNWNFLIEEAKGKYYILMHHDEFPLDKGFVNQVIEEVVNFPDTDVFIADCFLFDKKKREFRRHIPSIIRQKVLLDFPHYLFRRNVIGPTASLVVRRSLYQKFDCNFIWLIDVEQYYRLISISQSIRFSSKLKIVSYIGRNDSITASLGERIKRIRVKELKLLKKMYPQTSVWLNNNWPANSIEWFLWLVMRVITRAYSSLLSILGLYSRRDKDTIKRLIDDCK